MMSDYGRSLWPSDDGFSGGFGDSRTRFTGSCEGSVWRGTRDTHLRQMSVRGRCEVIQQVGRTESGEETEVGPPAAQQAVLATQATPAPAAKRLFNDSFPPASSPLFPISWYPNPLPYPELRPQTKRLDFGHTGSGSNSNFLRLIFRKLCFCMIFQALLTISPQHFLTPFLLRTQSALQISQLISQQIAESRAVIIVPIFEQVWHLKQFKE